MHCNLKAPSAGDALSAAWAREMVEEVRRARLSAAPPLTILSRGSAGTVIGLSRRPAGAPASVPGTWELEVRAGGLACCTNCMLMVTSVTFFADGDDMALTTSMSGEEGWLCGTLNTVEKVLGLVWGDPPTELQEDSELITFPLYFMVNQNGEWGKKIDARNMPQIGAYL